MTSLAKICNPVEHHMLTPENAALVIVDFEPAKIVSLVMMERRLSQTWWRS